MVRRPIRIDPLAYDPSDGVDRQTLMLRKKSARYRDLVRLLHDVVASTNRLHEQCLRLHARGRVDEGVRVGRQADREEARAKHLGEVITTYLKTGK